MTSDRVLVTFEQPADMLSFIEFVRTEDITLDEQISISVANKPPGNSKLASSFPSTVEIVVLAINGLAAVGTLLGLYLNRAGRKSITVLHTRTETRYSITGLDGSEAAEVLRAAAQESPSPKLTAADKDEPRSPTA